MQSRPDRDFSFIPFGMRRAFRRANPRRMRPQTNPLADARLFEGKLMEHRFTGQLRSVAAIDVEKGTVRFWQYEQRDRRGVAIERVLHKAVRWLRNAEVFAS